MLKFKPFALLALAALASVPASAIQMDDELAAEADEADAGTGGWSWEEGLLGDTIDGDVFTDDGRIYPGYGCLDCRDPEVFPVDFAAFAYNGFWGEYPWMRETRLGVPFRIYNRELGWVAVWFEDVYLDSFTFLPDTMQVHVRLPTGQILTFTVLQGGPDMPVGDPAPDAESDCGCTGGGSAGEGEDDPVVDESIEWEPPDYAGSVEIVDPDEDGEFPPWESEL